MRIACPRTAVFASLLLVTAFAVAAAPGDLDPSFGQGGIVSTTIAGAENRSNAMARQPDGKYVTAGFADVGHARRVAVHRFLANGALDPSFGNGGTALLSMGTSTRAEATSLALQPDGRILVAGPVDSSAFVARLNSNGTLDTTFASVGYRIRASYGFTSTVALQSGGRIVVSTAAVPSTGNGPTLSRYLADGTPDTTFGSGGSVVLANDRFSTTPYDATTSIRAFAIQPDDRIVVVTNSDNEQYAKVWRHEANGAIDATFAGGNALTVRYGDGYTRLHAVTLQADGRIVAAGEAGANTDSLAPAILRVLADGSLDASFGGTGLVSLPGTGTTAGNAVVVRSDGRIVMAGYQFTGPPYLEAVLLARVLADGQPDTAFAPNGRRTYAIGTSTEQSAEAMVLLPGDGAAIAGRGTPSSPDTLLAAFRADGSLDTALNGTGARFLDAGSLPGTATAIARQADGKLVVGAMVQRINSLSYLAVLIRYLPDGSLDPAFGVNGLVDAGSAITALALQPDGKILVAGHGRFDPSTTGVDFTVMRFDASGRADAAFGQSGIAIIPVTAGADQTAAIALQPDGRIVVAGTSGPIGGTTDYSFARLLANGALDASFGTGGTTVVALSANQDAMSGMKLLPDGRILASGTVYQASGSVAIGFVQLGTDGRPDSSFNGTGMLVRTMPSFTQFNGLARQPDGKLVVAGQYFGVATTDSVAVRFLADGSIDSAFGSGGIALTNNPGTQMRAVELLANGKIVLAGSRDQSDPSSPLSAIVIAQLMPNGALDAGFGSNGRVVTDATSGPDRALALLVQPDGNLVVAGTIGDLIGLARYQDAQAPAARLAKRVDFDGNGKSDLLLEGSDARVALWLMDGTRIASMAQVLGPNSGFTAVAMADLDGNGKTDILWQHGDGRVAAWLMDGTTITGGGTILGPGTGWSVARTADFNGDGKADILWRRADGTYAIWLMDGATMIGGGTILAGGAGWTDTRSADFDGDGRDDILWTHPDGRVSIWLMNGASVTGGGGILGPATGWRAIHAPDVNGDGKADVIWEHADGRVAVWLMNGATVTGGGGIFGGGTGWVVARTGDFNGDGKADLLWQHNDGRATIWLMDGAAALEQRQVLGSGGWFVKRTADLDGDGKSDIVWQHTNGSITVWLMNGTTSTADGDLQGSSAGGLGVSTLGQ